MKFVSEKIIDAVIDELENYSDEQYETQMEAFAEEQPVLFAWLFSEHFELLNEEEKGYLQYLSLIAWRSIVKTNGNLESASEEQIGLAEEANYAILDASNAKNFRDRLNEFFEGSDQEDLLAFAEEAVLEDEDDPESIVTKEGKEPIFIALKTMVDVLTGEWSMRNVSMRSAERWVRITILCTLLHNKPQRGIPQQRAKPVD